MQTRANTKAVNHWFLMLFIVLIFLYFIGCVLGLGTRKRLKFNGLQAFFFLQGTLFQPQSKPFYILCILHDQQVPHSLPTDFTSPRLILLSNHCFPTQNTNTASSAHEYNIIGSRIRYHWLTNTISSAHEYDMLFSPNQDRMGIV